MSVKIDPREVLSFNNIICPVRARQLYSFSNARSIYHLAVQINRHNSSHHDHCFLCRHYQVVLTTLLSRGHQKILLI